MNDDSDPLAGMRARVAALSDDQRQLLRQRIIAADPAAQHARIVAAVVVAKAGHTEPETLRSALRERLPAHMIPQEIRVLPALPRTAAGKVDRPSLVATLISAADSGEDRNEATRSAPRTRAESVLATIWAETLGFDAVGVHENFFELGGDSLLSIRILSRARKEGLVLSPETFFDKPTIAEQAAAAVADTQTAPRAAPSASDAPLLPIQHWFFERIRAEPHWNQELVLRITPGLDYETLQRAVAALLDHHDALRTRFHRRGDAWRQVFAPLERLPVLHARAEASGGLRVLRDAMADAHTAMDLEHGPLLRFILVTGGDEAPLLGIVAHHLIVDAVSWRILAEDLESLCDRLMVGAPPALPSRTVSVAEWSERLAAAADQRLVRNQAPYWIEAATAHETSLELEATAASANVEGAVERLRIDLDEGSTSLLYDPSRRPFGASVYEMLLASLAIALRQWCGRATTRVDLEGHGREAVFADLDVSRTVGWFTTVFPFALSAASDDVFEVLGDVQKTFTALPAGGIGYGVLREHASDDGVRRSLRDAPYSELCFNYLGSGALPAADRRGFAPVYGERGPTRGALAPRAYSIEVNTWRDGDSLAVEWGHCLDGRRGVIALSAAFRDALVSLTQGAAQAAPPPALPRSAADSSLLNLDEEDMSRLAEILARPEG